MSWPRAFIDQVRRAADGVRLVGEVVELKKRGARWTGLCPFHQEKTPSFTVSDEGLWYCFGCSEGGDIFKFVMQHEGLGFAEAVRSVAERAGVEVPESRPLPSDAGGREQVPRERLLAALSAAAGAYVEQLQKSPRALDYLGSRGLDPAVAERFGVGYAPAGWDNLSRALGARGFTPRELEAAGLVKRRGDGSGVYDLLRDRIVFPIRDLRGRTIAFGGRVLDAGEPKYINSPETALFAKGRTLYGIGEARDGVRQAGFVMLVEGYLDVLACAQHGFGNVVAPLGTAFTSEHARALTSFARKAVIAFDSDTAGLAAAERTVAAFLVAGFQVSVLALPTGQDPDSFLRSEGADGLKTALRGALPALTFLLQRATVRADVRTPQGKSQALTGLLSFVIEVEDRVERSEWIGRVANALDVRQDLVERAFADLVEQRRQRRPGPDTASGGGILRRLDTVPLAERDLLRAVLYHPEWLAPLAEIFGEGAVRDARVEELLAVVSQLVAEGHVSGPVEAGLMVGRCEAPGADALVSRLLLEDAEPGALEWEYARGCALGVRRDARRRELRQVQRDIEEAVRRGEPETELEALERRKLTLAQELAGG